MRHSWTLLAALFVGTLVFAVGCSGNGGSAGSLSSDGGWAGGDGGEDGGGVVEDPYYSNLRGFDVEDGAERVLIGRWPSWLHEKQLMDACSEHQVSYADRCWEEMIIDLDERSATFRNADGSAETIAIGEAMPAALGPMVLHRINDLGTAQLGRYMPHHLNTGYVDMGLKAPWQAWYDQNSLWGYPDAPELPQMASGRFEVPWALASEVQTADGAVAAFTVRTTQWFGFRERTVPGQFPTWSIVHNWSYPGHVRVNGQDLPLPVRLTDLEAATGASVTTDAGGALGRYIDLSDNTIRVASHPAVMAARKAYDVGGPGLSDADLVTSIELRSYGLIVTE